MAMAKHVSKRVLMMLAGYLVAVSFGLVSVVAIYAVLSFLPNAPAYFDIMGITPIAALAVPPVAMFIYALTMVVTCAQTLMFALIAEFFSLRNALLHMVFGAGAAVGGIAMIWPRAPEDIDPERWLDIGIVAAAGLIAGLVYWLIAGRDAGFRRPVAGR
ncbi:hypothetical protein [Mesorhizobium sp. ES1-1]|uniref:hypothetical protein n=1 Tax=Mesorhizobium sp. ES1-1 TaxID=2876629 RepID=UPI001CCB7AA3|nr:hypothetical protein [Mesorhizobium sp. ES1-1]MBZ9677652.1 hypothetical protein [Mesorhizobium sp. ES1-1]